MQTHVAREDDLTAERRLNAERAIRSFMTAVGHPPITPGLEDTPRRMAAMFLDEFFAPIEFSWTVFPAETTSMIVQTDIQFAAICEHHFIPFHGTATVAYIPNKKMVGLSKLARCVEYHARRAPTVQERMAEQIATMIDEAVEPIGVGVCLDAEHLCMTLRGIQKPGARTRISTLRGAILEEPAAREEFLHAIR